MRKNFIKKLLWEKTDTEIKSIEQIIKEVPDSSGECNQVFIDRLQKNREALKMSFWEEHFEWKSLGMYPELKGRILDFGCGSGHMDVILARNGSTVHGIDLSPIGINIANHLRSSESDEVKKRLSFQLADVTIERPNDQQFDAAWACHVFEHIKDPQPVICGLREWLRPGAFMLISVPLGYAYDDPGHVIHFEDERHLIEYLQRYVSVQRVDICSQDCVLRALVRFE